MAAAGSLTELMRDIVLPLGDDAFVQFRQFTRRAWRNLTWYKVWCVCLKLVVASVYLSTGALLLSGFAAGSYFYFYYAYLPQGVTTVPVHLQYGLGAHPYGFASLANLNLKSRQPYDFTVTLVLPRSPANLDRGNFMVSLHLLDGDPPPVLAPSFQQILLPPPQQDQPAPAPPPPLGQTDPRAHAASQRVLFAAARPAILPYTHPTVARVSRLAFLAYHVLFPHAAETATLRMPLAERLSFGGGHFGAMPLPRGLLVEVRGGQDLQVYEASVTMTARLRGLRWFMYHHRVLTFLALASAFWVVEVLAMACTYYLWRRAVWRDWAKAQGRVRERDNGPGRRRGLGDDGGSDSHGHGRGGGGGHRAAELPRLSAQAKGKMKAEPGDPRAMSDTERTFPSTSKQPRVKFEVDEVNRLLAAMESDGGEAVKVEEEEDEQEGEGEREGEGQGVQQREGGEEARTMATALGLAIPPAGDADDEGEASFRDSGIGTSYSDRAGGEGPGARRRPTTGKRAASS